MVKQAVWTNGFNLFRIYCAIKAHLSDSFDINKYGLKTKIPLDTYNKRSDRVFFERLASKNDAEEAYKLMLLNMIGNEDCISYELASAGAYSYYLNHSGRIDRIHTVYRKDLEEIFLLLKTSQKKFKDLLIGTSHPVILQLLIQNKICIETVLLIDSFLPILDEVNKQYKSDILWNPWYIKMSRYRTLTVINSQLAKDIFLDVKANM